MGLTFQRGNKTKKTKTRDVVCSRQLVIWKKTELGMVKDLQRQKVVCKGGNYIF